MTKMKMYYVYRHIRLDKNQPFYIGVGTIYHQTGKEQSKFARAYQKNRRNIHWNHIVNKSDYEVEILFVSYDKNFILEKEIELIALYKRKDDGGILCNKSSGGEFSGAGVIISEKESKRRSEFFTKLWSSRSSPRSKKVYQYDLSGNLLQIHESLRKAGKNLNINYRKIGHFIKSINKSSFKIGFLFSYDLLNQDEAILLISEKRKRNKFENKITKFKNKQIDQFNIDGTFITRWNSFDDISNILNYNIKSLKFHLNGKMKTYKGYLWKLVVD